MMRGTTFADGWICIYVINERDDALRVRFEAHSAEICISSITYAELCYGVANSVRVAENTRELEAFRLDLEILPFGEDAAAHYGEVRHALRKSGQPIGANDLFIAAHARPQCDPRYEQPRRLTVYQPNWVWR